MSLNKLVIATGQSRTTKIWKNTNISWESLVERLRTTTRTTETVGQYTNMTKSQQDNIKDVGGFVGGSLRQGRRKSDSVDKRYIITLDADFASVDFCDTVELFLDCAYCIYSTHKHTHEKPRLRLLIPLSRTCSSDEYEAVSRKIAQDIGIDMFDDTTYQAHRLMYWPSTSYDGEYLFKHKDNKFLDVDNVLKTYSDWKDITQWPVSSRTLKVKDRLLKKQEDPTSKRGIVGAFCRAYNTEDVIETFLADIYQKCSVEARYTYIHGSTAAGVVVYDNGSFVYSNHATDPISGMLCNAFDLLRIHKYRHLDEDADDGTPTVKLPSYLAMQEFAAKDNVVKLTLHHERVASIKDDFGGMSADDDIKDYDNEDVNNDDWILELDTNKKGEYLASIEAFKKILSHDKALKGKIALNEFTGKYKVRKSLPWDTNSTQTVVERDWTDTDDSGLRHYFERTYNLKGKALIDDAWVLTSGENKFHPIKDYLNSLIWDGTPRLENLLINYLGANDSEYVKTVTKKALTAAVARIFVPGIKYDNVLVLVGPQGCGKSQIIKRLGMDWFSDTLTTVQGKEAYEQIQGFWIVEIAELAAMKKMEVEAIKHFTAKSEDAYRAAYGKHTQVYKRQCIFFGTTNTYEFLKDMTGNRRFWPVDAHPDRVVRSVWEDLSKGEVDQIWAEAYECFKNNERVYLDDERVKALAEAEQDKHLEESPMTGDIRMFLDTFLPDNWEDYDLSQRRQFIQGNEFGKTVKGTVKRTKVCPIEIWCELFNADKKDFTIQKSKEIRDIIVKTGEWELIKTVARFDLYGPQRGFINKKCNSVTV